MRGDKDNEVGRKEHEDGSKQEGNEDKVKLKFGNKDLGDFACVSTGSCT